MKRQLTEEQGQLSGSPIQKREENWKTPLLGNELDRVFTTATLEEVRETAEKERALLI